MNTNSVSSSITDNLSEMSHSGVVDTVGENSDVNFADHSELSEESDTHSGDNHNSSRVRRTSKSSTEGKTCNGSQQSQSEPLKDSSAVRKIYTEWANHYLEKAKATRFVDDLQKDLCDGILLVEVITAVTGEKVAGLKTSHRSKDTAIENVNKCLAHMRRIGVNVDDFHAKDIVDGKLKTILGLFFNLSRYKQQLKAQEPTNGKQKSTSQSSSFGQRSSSLNKSGDGSKTSGIPSIASRKYSHGSTPLKTSMDCGLNSDSDQITPKPGDHLSNAIYPINNRPPSPSSSLSSCNYSTSSTGIPLPRRLTSSVERTGAGSSVSSVAGSLTSSSVASVNQHNNSSPSLRKPTTRVSTGKPSSSSKSNSSTNVKHHSSPPANIDIHSLSSQEDKMFEKFKLFKEKANGHSKSSQPESSTLQPSTTFQQIVSPPSSVPQFSKSHMHTPSRRLQSPSVHTKIVAPSTSISSFTQSVIPTCKSSQQNLQPSGYSLSSSYQSTNISTVPISSPSSVVFTSPSAIVSMPVSSQGSMIPFDSQIMNRLAQSSLKSDGSIMIPNELNSSSQDPNNPNSRIPGIRKAHHHHHHGGRNDRQKAKELYAAMKSREASHNPPPPQSSSAINSSKTMVEGAMQMQFSTSNSSNLSNHTRLKYLETSSKQKQFGRCQPQTPEQSNNVRRGMEYLSDQEIPADIPPSMHSQPQSVSTASVSSNGGRIGGDLATERSFISTTSMSGYSSDTSNGGGGGYVSEGAISEYSRKLQERFRGGLMLPVQETSEGNSGDVSGALKENTGDAPCSNAMGISHSNDISSWRKHSSGMGFHSDVDGEYGSIYSTSSRSAATERGRPSLNNNLLNNSAAYAAYLQQLRRSQERHYFSDTDPSSNNAIHSVEIPTSSAMAQWQQLQHTKLSSCSTAHHIGGSVAAVGVTGSSCFTHPNSILAAAAAAASQSRLKRNGSFSSDRDKIYGIALPPALPTTLTSSNNPSHIKSNAGPAPAALLFPSEWSDPSSVLFSSPHQHSMQPTPAVGNLIHFGPGFRAPRLNNTNSAQFSTSPATLPHKQHGGYRSGSLTGGSNNLKYSSDSEYAPPSTCSRISPAPSLNSIKLPYNTVQQQMTSTRLLHDTKDDDPDVKGSSLSLASAGSCRSANEERQSLEIRKLKRELEIAQQKVTTLSSRLNCNSHVALAFEQSLNSMTTRLLALSNSAEQKDSELGDLKRTIDSLREQSRQQLSQDNNFMTMNPALPVMHAMPIQGGNPLPIVPGPRTGPLPPTPNMNSQRSMSAHESPSHPMLSVMHPLFPPAANPLLPGYSSASVVSPATPLRKSSSGRHGSFSRILRPTRSTSQQEEMMALAGGVGNVSMLEKQSHHPGGLIVSGSLTSLESVLSANPIGGPGKKSGKKSWFRASLGKAFRKKSSKSGAMSDVEGETTMSPHRLYNESTSQMKESHSTGMIHNPYSTDELLMMRKELEEKDMKLTDVRLEALSSAHRLEQLKELVNRMRHEMSTLKADNERLQRLMLSSGLSSLECHDLLTASVTSAPTTFLDSGRGENGGADGVEDAGMKTESRSETQKTQPVNPQPKLGSPISTDDMRLIKGLAPLCSDTEKMALDRLVAPALMWNDCKDPIPMTDTARQYILLPVAAYLGSVSDNDMQLGTRSIASGGVMNVGNNIGMSSMVDLRSTDIGLIMLRSDHTWSELENQLTSLLCDYAHVVDPLTNLGLTEESLASFRLVDVFRRRDASITPDEGVVHDDADSIEDGSPWAVVQRAISSSGSLLTGPVEKKSGAAKITSPQKGWISLLGSASTSGSPNGCCLDALAFESLVPKPMLQRYVSLLLEHRRIIFSGSPGTGKTYLAQKLAEFLVARCGRRLAGAVVTFNVDHKSLKELRNYLTQMAEQIERTCSNSNGGCSNSPPTIPSPSNCGVTQLTTPPELPVVIILDNLHHAGSLYDILQCLIAMKLQKCPYIIGTMNQSSCNTMDLKLHHNFRWVLCSNHMEPVKGFLGRYLRRKLCHMQVECHGASSEMFGIVQWMPLVWQRLNQFLETHNSVDVTLGPRLFLSCPMSVEGSQVWFTDLWNYSLVPYIMEAVREGLQQYGRRCAWEDPVEWIIRTWPWTVPPPLGEKNSNLISDRNLLTVKDMRTQLIPLRPEDVGYEHQPSFSTGPSTTNISLGIVPTSAPNSAGFLSDMNNIASTTPPKSSSDSGPPHRLNSLQQQHPLLQQNHFLPSLGNPNCILTPSSGNSSEDTVVAMLLRLQEVAKYGTGLCSESSGSHSDSNSSVNDSSNSPGRRPLSRTA